MVDGTTLVQKGVLKDSPTTEAAATNDVTDTNNIEKRQDLPVDANFKSTEEVSSETKIDSKEKNTKYCRRTEN